MISKKNQKIYICTKNVWTEQQNLFSLNEKINEQIWLEKNSRAALTSFNSKDCSVCLLFAISWPV